MQGGTVYSRPRDFFGLGWREGIGSLAAKPHGSPDASARDGLPATLNSTLPDASVYHTIALPQFSN